MRATVGVPDILGTIRGRMVALELKASSDKKATKIQKYVLNKIDRAGGVTFVVHPDNWGEVLVFLRRMHKVV